jgi:hypothetical protein
MQVTNVAAMVNLPADVDVAGEPGQRQRTLLKLREGFQVQDENRVGCNVGMPTAPASLPSCRKIWSSCTMSSGFSAILPVQCFVIMRIKLQGLGNNTLLPRISPPN